MSAAFSIFEVGRMPWLGSDRKRARRPRNLIAVGEEYTRKSAEVIELRKSWSPNGHHENDARGSEEIVIMC